MTLALTDYETGYAVGHLLAVIFIFALIAGGLIWALIFLFGRQRELRLPLPPATPPDVWPPAPQEKAQKRAADDSKGMP